MLLYRRLFLLEEGSKENWALKNHCKGNLSLLQGRSKDTWALGHSKGTWALRHSGTWALRHSGTWALEALEAPYLADSQTSMMTHFGENS